MRALHRGEGCRAQDSGDGAHAHGAQEGQGGGALARIQHDRQPGRAHVSPAPPAHLCCRPGRNGAPEPRGQGQAALRGRAPARGALGPDPHHAAPHPRGARGPHFLLPRRRRAAVQAGHPPAQPLRAPGGGAPHHAAHHSGRRRAPHNCGRHARPAAGPLLDLHHQRPPLQHQPLPHQRRLRRPRAQRRRGGAHALCDAAARPQLHNPQPRKPRGALPERDGRLHDRGALQVQGRGARLCRRPRRRGVGLRGRRLVPHGLGRCSRGHVHRRRARGRPRGGRLRELPQLLRRPAALHAHREARLARLRGARRPLRPRAQRQAGPHCRGHAQAGDPLGPREPGGHAVRGHGVVRPQGRHPGNGAQLPRGRRLFRGGHHRALLRPERRVPRRALARVRQGGLPLPAQAALPHHLLGVKVLRHVHQLGRVHRL
mmetsp:Transcript_308/g.1021  ORF Transcript_308/g.1021 Transcript_308/m.1021 type:complete len:429 (+) Transcript_308:296-1582(+)